MMGAGVNFFDGCGCGCDFATPDPHPLIAIPTVYGLGYAPTGWLCAASEGGVQRRLAGPQWLRGVAAGASAISGGEHGDGHCEVLVVPWWLGWGSGGWDERHQKEASAVEVWSCCQVVIWSEWAWR
jgi:hypothetical protein